MSYSFGDCIGQVSNGDLSKEKKIYWQIFLSTFSTWLVAMYGIVLWWNYLMIPGYMMLDERVYWWYRYNVAAIWLSMIYHYMMLGLYRWYTIIWCRGEYISMIHSYMMLRRVYRWYTIIWCRGEYIDDT